VCVTASTNKMPDGVTKADFCKTLGADEVIDYKSTKWFEALAGQGFDLIFDTIGDQDDWANASKAGFVGTQIENDINKL
jgi:NADPH:quinone reductase-like Zn-dependent oxidoreductase